MSLINYNVDPVAYSEHLKIGHTTLYYPLIVHGKFNNRWIHAVDCGIGANGTYSMVYADIFDQVTSIDAVISPNAHKHLDNIDNVNLISHCLYSSTGNELTFYRPEDDPALGSLYKSFLFHNLSNPETQTNISECKLTTTKIDDIIDTPIDFIKTDLEGADAEAILGAKEVISKYRPTIVTDGNDHLIVKILNNLGYKQHQHAQEFCKDAIFFPEEVVK